MVLEDKETLRFSCLFNVPAIWENQHVVHYITKNREAGNKKMLQCGKIVFRDVKSSSLQGSNATAAIQLNGWDRTKPTGWIAASLSLLAISSVIPAFRGNDN